VPGNDLIPTLRHGSEAGNVAVAPESESAPGPRAVTKHPKDSFCAGIDSCVGLDQMNSGAKTVNWYVCYELLSNRLKRGNINPSAGRFLPTPDPAYAKITVRVVDEKRFLGRRGAMSQAVRATNLCRLLVSPGFRHCFSCTLLVYLTSLSRFIFNGTSILHRENPLQRISVENDSGPVARCRKAENR